MNPSPRPAPILGLIAAASAILLALPVQALQPFLAHYDLIRDGLTAGRVDLSLQSTGPDSYLYRRFSQTAGLVALFRDDQIDETSRFQWPDKQAQAPLKPQAYRYLRSGKKPRLVSVRFDWQQGLAHNQYKGKTWSETLKPNTLDKLCVELKLASDLQARKAQGQLQNQSSFHYSIADGGYLKTYHYRWLRSETIDTDAGQYPTEVVQRHYDNNRRATTLWFAPDLDYALVKIEHAEGNDGTVTMTLTRFVPMR